MFLVVASALACAGATAAQTPTYFCDASDGSLASCPCANPGNDDSGCDNAQGTGGARLTYIHGTYDPVTRTVDLIGTGFNPAAAVSIVPVRSTATHSAVVFGDGITCLVPPVQRLKNYFGFAVNGTWPGPSSSWPSPAGAPQLWQPNLSGTYYYQLFYRNTPGTYCDGMSWFNWSNGLSLTW
jgi:hypothetical protein